MNNYNDKVTWFLKEEYLRYNLTFFSTVYTSTRNDYKTFSELNSLNSTEKFKVQSFNVERVDIDTLVLSIKPYVGTDIIKSIALVTTVNQDYVLIARIDVSDDEVPFSYRRVISLKVPSFKRGDSKQLLNFSTDFARSAESPVGDEIVSVQEHHHLVKWGNESDEKDEIPTVPSSNPRFLLSALYTKTQPSERVISQVYGEQGKSYNSTVANSVGKIVESNTAGTLEKKSELVSRVVDTAADIIANVMEEYLMANNSIQILGQQIPEKDKAFLNSTDAENKAHILVTDTASASNTRSLFHLDPSTLRDWLVEKQNPTASSASTNACVTLVTITNDLTFNFNKKSQVAIFYNANEVSATAGVKKITCGSVSANIYPQDTLIFVKDTSNNITVFQSGVSQRIDQILQGNIGFNKIAFSSKDGLWNSIASQNITLNPTTSYLTFANSNLKFNDLTLTGKLQGTSATFNSSITATKVTVSDGFYIGS